MRCAVKEEASEPPDLHLRPVSVVDNCAVTTTGDLSSSRVTLPRLNSSDSSACRRTSAHRMLQPVPGQTPALPVDSSVALRHASRH